MKSDQACPGSTEENPHNLVIINSETGNKLCDNDRCYFVIQYRDGSGAWQYGFDYLNPKSLVKPKVNDK